MNKISELQTLIKETTLKEEAALNDHVGKIHIVLYPTDKSELKDILFDADIPGILLQAKGGLQKKDIAGLYPENDKDLAERQAKRLLNLMKATSIPK